MEFTNQKTCEHILRMLENAFKEYTHKIDTKNGTKYPTKIEIIADTITEDEAEGEWEAMLAPLDGIEDYGLLVKCIRNEISPCTFILSEENSGHDDYARKTIKIKYPRTNKSTTSSLKPTIETKKRKWCSCSIFSCLSLISLIFLFVAVITAVLATKKNFMEKINF